MKLTRRAVFSGFLNSSQVAAGQIGSTNPIPPPLLLEDTVTFCKDLVRDKPACLALVGSGIFKLHISGEQKMLVEPVQFPLGITIESFAHYRESSVFLANVSFGLTNKAIIILMDSGSKWFMNAAQSKVAYCENGNAVFQLSRRRGAVTDLSVLADRMSGEEHHNFSYRTIGEEDWILLTERDVLAIQSGEVVTLLKCNRDKKFDFKAHSLGRLQSIDFDDHLLCMLSRSVVRFYDLSMEKQVRTIRINPAILKVSQLVSLGLRFAYLGSAAHGSFISLIDSKFGLIGEPFDLNSRRVVAFC